MSRRPTVKSNYRFVMHIPNALRKEIEEQVNKMGITYAEFGRDAFELYLNKKRKEEKDAQLAETCRLFETSNNSVFSEWTEIEVENWPA